MDLKFYLSLFLRRLHWFLLLFIICSAVGLTLARILPPAYVAQARMLVESEQIPGELAESMVQTEAAEQLQIIQQRILSRETLIEMANRLNIYGPPGSPERLAVNAEDIVNDLRERVSINATGVSGNARSRAPVQTLLVGVSFKDGDPQVAAAVTNELVTQILREDVNRRTAISRQTLDFFEQEVRRLDRELAEAGRRILDFKEQNQSALPDSLEFRRSQLAANQERRLLLDREEAALREQRQRMVRLHEGLSAARGTAPDRPLTDEERQLRQLEDERAAQLAVLSPENPRIRMLDARIAALKEVVTSQQAAGAAVGGEAPLSAYQVQLAELDSKLDFIALQKEQLTEAAENLQLSIQQTPANTITLDTLERDYAAINAQYSRAVGARAQAETGDMIEALSKGQRITVVENAVVPTAPTSPNRILIAGGGIGLGFFAGLAVIVLLELLNTGIRRPVDISNKLGITPLATLPYMRTRRESWVRRAIILSGLSALLIGIPLALWALHTYYVPLDLLMNRILGRFGLATLIDPTLPFRFAA